MSELGDDSLDPVTFLDLPLDAIHIIVDQLAWNYWETAAQMQDRPRIRCTGNGSCQDNPAFTLSSPDGQGPMNTSRSHFHVPDLMHRRNIKLAAQHHIDHGFASEASPWLWNSWVINLSSVNRFTRAEIFDERIMRTFYLQSLRLDYVEEAENFFGREKLATIRCVGRFVNGTVD